VRAWVPDVPVRHSQDSLWRDIDSFDCGSARSARAGNQCQSSFLQVRLVVKRTVKCVIDARISDV
jgi:hypothetical protein